MEWGLKRGWTNSCYCSEYELAIFRKGVESGRKALRNKIQSLQAELEAVKNVLANVKGVANFYNSEHHANYNYEGKVFAKDLNKMLKGKGE